MPPMRTCSTRPLNTPPLTAVQADYLTTGGGNGMYNVGGHSFPTSTFNGSSYGVDVIFDTTQPAGAPPVLTSVTPYPGSSSNPVSTGPTATFSKAVVPSTAVVHCHGSERDHHSRHNVIR